MIQFYNYERDPHRELAGADQAADRAGRWRDWLHQQRIRAHGDSPQALAVKRFREVEILSPRQFITLIAGGKR